MELGNSRGSVYAASSVEKVNRIGMQAPIPLRYAARLSMDVGAVSQSANLEYL